jgi:hypothetical protein
VFKKRRILLSSITSLLAITLTAIAASPASAGPTPGAPPSSSPTHASKMSVDEAINAILRSNPKARRVRPNTVNVAPGVDLTYGPVPAANTVVGAADVYYQYCRPYYLCVWQHTIGDGFGYELKFYYCEFLNLNEYRFPDFAYVGRGPSVYRWNDKISAYENSQSSGTVSIFYNWYGYWGKVRTSTAFDAYYDLTQIGINDIIDGIRVC